MSDKTKIEWTEATWNPIIARRKDNGKRGWFCTKPSTGCKFCYAERLNIRLGTGLPYTPASLEEINIELHEETLIKPLRWTRPRMIFGESMGDLFHENVSFEIINKIFAVMAICPQHTFQVLTKRPERALQWFAGEKLAERWERIRTAASLLSNRVQPEWDWPLENVWFGVSCENQQTADERIPILLQIPAAIRWLSCEPLLGEINLSAFKPFSLIIPPNELAAIKKIYPNGLPSNCLNNTLICNDKIDWVVVGGESGRKDQDIRPMHPKWARSLRDQCVASGVPFFFKQWGEYAPRCAAINEPSEWDGMNMVRVGKKSAGRLLDGKEWNQYPNENHHHA